MSTVSSQSKQATVIAAGEGRRLNVLGHVVNVMLGNAETQGATFVFETITPPGLAVPVHLHEYEDEYGYVAEGVFEFYLDGRTLEATTGAILTLPAPYLARLPKHRLDRWKDDLAFDPWCRRGTLLR